MGRGSIRGDDRSAVIISLLALQSAGGDAEHCTVWGTVHAAAEIATHVCTAAGTPVRSHPLYQLPRRVKPVCAGGLPLQAVDLSVLPDKEPIPPALRGEHHRAKPPRRTDPAVRDLRVRAAVGTGSGSTVFPLRGGHVFVLQGGDCRIGG